MPRGTRFSRWWQSAENRQQFGLGTAQMPGMLVGQDRVRIFLDLFWRFKITIVGPRVVVFAFVRGVVATNLRTGFVDSATLVLAQVLADRVNQQVPGFVFGKYAGPIVQQVPANELKVLPASGRIDRQSKVSAAFCGAKGAKNLARFQFAS